MRPSVRLRQRLSRGAPPREELVARHVAGRSFVDVGCMWSVDGAIAFAAEKAGATNVTGVDVMGESPEYLKEHARRGSHVRFVQGDLHDPATVGAVGVTTSSGARASSTTHRTRCSPWNGSVR